MIKKLNNLKKVEESKILDNTSALYDTIETFHKCFLTNPFYDIGYRRLLEESSERRNPDEDDISVIYNTTLINSFLYRSSSIPGDIPIVDMLPIQTTKNVFDQLLSAITIRSDGWSLLRHSFYNRLQPGEKFFFDLTEFELFSVIYDYEYKHIKDRYDNVNYNKKLNKIKNNDSSIIELPRISKSHWDIIINYAGSIIRSNEGSLPIELSEHLLREYYHRGKIYNMGPGDNSRREMKRILRTIITNVSSYYLLDFLISVDKELSKIRNRMKSNVFDPLLVLLSIKSFPDHQCGISRSHFDLLLKESNAGPFNLGFKSKLAGIQNPKTIDPEGNIEEIPIISRSQDYQRGIETEIQLEAWLDFVYQEVGYDYDYKKEKDYKVLIKDVDKGIDMMHERNNFWAVPSKVVKSDEDDLPF